jgi:protein-tyrosine sulfotransferase
LFMVRDGRATVHSIITRKVTITGFDLKSYRQCLTKWNAAITAMNDQCTELGPDHCLKVPYEQLVLHPRKWMENILEFLDLSWTENVLHHEKQINKPNGISLSKVERSSDQVKLFQLQFNISRINSKILGLGNFLKSNLR